MPISFRTERALISRSCELFRFCRIIPNLKKKKGGGGKGRREKKGKEEEKEKKEKKGEGWKSVGLRKMRSSPDQRSTALYHVIYLLVGWLCWLVDQNPTRAHEWVFEGEEGWRLIVLDFNGQRRDAAYDISPT